MPRRAEWRGRPISGALVPYWGFRLLTARYTGGFGTLPLANRLVHDRSPPPETKDGLEPVPNGAGWEEHTRGGSGGD